MKYQEINVPLGFRYLSQWHELLNLLPQSGKYILNKVNTGCGGTTLFLESPQPVILVSPRINVLYSKSEQFPKAHLFRKRTDTSTPVPTLKQRLKDYIDNCRPYTMPWGTVQPIIPKILVTIDSYPYVAEQLRYMGILDQFTVVVDEFQCLMGDSKFKGKTELQFLNILYGVKSVCYMSATPIDENYLNFIPEFSDVSTYFKLIWDFSVLERPNLRMIPFKAHQSSKGICKEIIAEYRRCGYFKQKLVNGSVVNSTEVVIFLNDVRTIVQIIKENKLDPDEVNVLCSASNKHVKDLRTLGSHIGELATDPNNPVNRTFTFCSRASFEGVDFYSTSAFTYIFSDGILDWNRADLVIDVPQILGRQRLDQPFRKDAVLYYRANGRADTEAIRQRIKQKEDATRRWIEKYNASDDETKRMLKDGIDKRSDETRYADDYVEFVDHLHGGFEVKENSLVMSTEIRDWQLSNYVYESPISILKNVVDNTNINVTSGYGLNTLSGCSVLDKFNHDFFKATTFPEKMQTYSEMRSNHPEHAEEICANPHIDYRYHQYYNVLGEDKLRALRYREKEIVEEVNSVLQYNSIADECKKSFVSGRHYSSAEVKSELQKIYEICGVNRTAKAIEILKYLPGTLSQQLTTKMTGKREIYYKIKW